MKLVFSIELGEQLCPLWLHLCPELEQWRQQGRSTLVSAVTGKVELQQQQRLERSCRFLK